MILKKKINKEINMPWEMNVKFLNIWGLASCHE